MDVLKSSEFRKRYAQLTDTTEVTVNGRVIGLWTPRQWGLGEQTPSWPPHEYTRQPIVGPPAIAMPGESSFTQFRPVPKPGKGK